MALLNGNLPCAVSCWPRLCLSLFLLAPWWAAEAGALPIDGRVEFVSGLSLRPTVAEVAASAERFLERSQLTLRPTDGAVLTLRDGRVWWGARIVAIGTSVATVSHDGGLAGVSVESVPLQELQRTEDSIAAAVQRSKRWQAAEAEREIERTKATLLAAQRALAVVPAPAEDATRPAPISAIEADVAELKKSGAVPRLTALKRKFPVRTKGRTDLGLEYDIPAAEVWLFYRRTLEAATMETLPETLAYLESRVSQNLDIWHWRAKTTESMPQSREHLVAVRTQAWLDRPLRNYLAELRLLLRER